MSTHLGSVVLLCIWPANMGYGIAGLKEGSGIADGQVTALGVNAEVSYY